MLAAAHWLRVSCGLARGGSCAFLAHNSVAYLALSLGTSDTLLGVTAASEAKPQVEGHIMAHPTDPEAVFAMLCRGVRQ